MAPDAVVADRRAVTLLVRNALFSRVRLASHDDWRELGAIDEAWGWRAMRWKQALDAYFAEHEEILLDADARSISYFEVDEADERADHVWHVRQMFKDEAGDRDFGIFCDVDLDATQLEGEAIFASYNVGFIEDLLAPQDEEDA